MYVRHLFIGAALLFTLQALPAQAQEGPPKASRLENARHVIVSSFRFKQDKVNEALEYGRTHLGPVYEDLGQEIVSYEPVFGDYHLVVVLPLPEGMREFEYNVSPFDERWFARLAEREGGWANAQKVLEQFNSMVEERKNDLAIIRSE